MTGRVQVAGIEEQLERVFEGEAWHGTPILGALADVSFAQAISRPIAGGHSIWEIVNHMTSWLLIVRERVGGVTRSEIPQDLDWPTPTVDTEEAWRDSKDRLRMSYVGLREFLGELVDDDLKASVEGKIRTYSAYVELHGVIQHSTYHAGQIAVLAKGTGGG